jgi:hypothetical protein
MVIEKNKQGGCYMYCTKCGEQNPDDIFFCYGCGARLDGERTVESESAAGTRDKIKIISGMIAIAIIIGIVASVISWAGKGYDRTAAKYLDAVYDADAQGVIELVPDEVVDYLLEDTGHDDLNGFIEEFTEVLQEYADGMTSAYVKNYGDDGKISCKITGAADIKDDALDKVRAYYADMNINIEISTAKTVIYDLTVKDKETKTSQTVSMCATVIKVGRTWYLDYFNTSMYLN